MSNTKLPSSRDFSMFDHLSTAELERLVRQYSLAEYEETDDEAILYILEVIAQRNELNTDWSPSAEKAWESFTQEYLSQEDPKALPGLSGNTGTATGETHTPVIDIKAHPSKNIHKSARRWFKPLSGTAAIAMIVVLACTGTVYAYKHDFWDSVATWTEETFRFDIFLSSGEQTGRKLARLLEDYGIPKTSIPTWMPDGYEIVSNTVEETTKNKVFKIQLKKESHDIIFIIRAWNDPQKTTFYIVDNDVKPYKRNDMDFFILQNEDSLTISWVDSTYECSIRGDITVTEAETIIQSISEE